MWKKISHKVTSSKFFILYFKKYNPLFTLRNFPLRYIHYIRIERRKRQLIKEEKRKKYSTSHATMHRKIKNFPKNERATKRAQMWSNTVKLDKSFHWPRIVTERQAIRIGVKGHGGVDQQGPVTSLLKLGQNERLSEICHDLPERQRLHGALSGSSGSSNWIVTIRLTSIFPMYLRDIVVLENSRKSRRFAIEPGRIGQIPHPPSFFSPSSRGSRAVGKG